MKELEDNTIQMKKDLEMFMYQLRIEAEVHVLEMVSPNYQADQVYTNFVSWSAYNVLNQIVKDFFLLLYLKTILSNKYVFIRKSNICDTFEKKGKNQLFKNWLCTLFWHCKYPATKVGLLTFTFWFEKKATFCSPNRVIVTSLHTLMKEHWWWNKEQRCWSRWRSRMSKRWVT